ncbi:MAG: zinc ribbon domain-containing protein [Anaerolineales bacterium]|nr:zinc ribbon domain-containing protein [Anaerolineales bacterium]
MPLESLDCPNCGAPLPDAGGRPIVICAHCGSSIRVASEPPAAPPPAFPTTTGEYGRPPEARPERSPLASVTLGPSDAAEVLRLLREKQRVEAIQFYHERVGGSIGEAVEAIEAIEAGLKDAAAPLPPPLARPTPSADISAIMDLLRRGNRLEAIRRYREQTGSDLQRSVTAIEGLERQMGRGRTRTVRGRGGCALVAAVIVSFVLGISSSCGVYLQTKPIFACSLDVVKSTVARRGLLEPPVQAGYLVLTPSLEESSGFDSWRLSAEYFTPVWGADGWGVAYVSVASSSTGRNAASARLYTLQGSYRLRDWGPLDCPSSDD